MTPLPPVTMVPPVDISDECEFPHLFGRIKPCLVKARAKSLDVVKSVPRIAKPSGDAP